MQYLKKLIVSLFLILALISLSLYVFRFIGYSFSIAFFLSCLIIAVSVKHLPINSWKIYFLLMFHQYLVIVLFILELDFVEFIKSFLLVNITLLSIISSKFYTPRIFFKLNLKVILSIAVVIIVLFELVQVLEYSILGTSFSWFLLDSISISSAEDVSRFQAVNFLTYMRPVSLFHEPSYLAFVLFAILTWLDLLKSRLYIKLLTAFGIMLTFSSTIFVFLFLYYIPKVYKNKYLKGVFVLSLLYLIIKYNFTIFEFFRFNEIAREGTSGYARIGAPFFQVIDILFYQTNYFGIPFGQSPIVFDNSFFVILSYYGILTPLFYYLLFGSVIKNLRDNLMIYNYFLIVGACLMVNGAFFTPESGFLILMTNYFTTNSLNKEFI